MHPKTSNSNKFDWYFIKKAGKAIARNDPTIFVSKLDEQCFFSIIILLNYYCCITWMIAVSSEPDI